MVKKPLLFSSKRYKVISSLGKGGMGDVYLAQDLKLKRKVAIKTIRSLMSDDPKILERTLREGRILANLSHPSIVTVYAMDTSVSTPYIVQEYVDGGDLRSVISDEEFFDESSALQLLREQASALSYLHKEGVIHRDIKPENIMIDSEGNSRLMDFGLALSYDHTRITEEGNFVGTLRYCSPETLRGAEAQPSSDIFQIGLVFFEAITGMNLYGKFRTYNEFLTIVLNAQWEKKLLKGIFPERLIPLLKACTTAEPENRIQDGQALCDYLDKNFSLTKTNEVKKVIGTIPRQLKGKKSLRSSIDVKELKTKSLRKFFGVAIIFVCIFTLLATTLDLRGLLELFSFESPQPLKKLVSRSRSWLLFPDGFFLFLPGGEGEQLRWEFHPSPSRYSRLLEASGSFKKVAGGWKAVHQFPVKASRELKPNSLSISDRKQEQSGILSIYDGQQLLGTGAVNFPASLLKSKFKVLLAYDSIDCSWEFNGKSKADLIFEELNPDKSMAKIIKISERTDSYRATLKQLGLSNSIRVSLVVPSVNEKDGYGNKSFKYTENKELLAATFEGEGSFQLRSVLPFKKNREYSNHQFNLGKYETKSPRSEIISTLINEDRLYVLTGSGEFYSFITSGDSNSYYEKAWVMTAEDIINSDPQFTDSLSLKSNARSLIMLKNGSSIDLYGIGNRVYTVDKNGSVTSSMIPFSSRHLMSRVMAVYESGQTRLLKCIFMKDYIYLLWRKGEECKVVNFSDQEYQIRRIFSGSGNFFAWVSVKDCELLYYLDESHDLLKWVLVDRYPTMKPGACLMCFGASFNGKHALFSVKDKLYFIRNQSSYSLGAVSAPQEIPLNLPPFSGIGGIVQSGDDQYICAFFSGVDETSYLVSKVTPTANVLFVNIKPTGIKTEFGEYNHKVVTESHRCPVKGPLIVDADSLCFSAGLNFFIVSRRDGSLEYTKSFFTVLRKLSVGNNVIIAEANYQGLLYGLSVLPAGRPH